MIRKALLVLAIAGAILLLARHERTASASPPPPILHGLRVTKTCPSSAAPGDPVTCNFTVRSVGTDGVDNLIVTNTVGGVTSAPLDCHLPVTNAITTSLGPAGSTDGSGNPIDYCTGTVDETMPASCSDTLGDRVYAIGDAEDASCTSCISAYDEATISGYTCTPTPAGTATPTATPTRPPTAYLIVNKLCQHSPGPAPGANYTCTFAIQNRWSSTVTDLTVTDVAPYPGGITSAVSCVQGDVVATALGPFGSSTDTCAGSVTLTMPACSTSAPYVFPDRITASGTATSLGTTISGVGDDFEVVPVCVASPTVTGTPPTSTPTGTPTNTPTNTTTPPTNTPTVTGTPPTVTPTPTRTFTPVFVTPVPTCSIAPVCAVQGGMTISVLGPGGPLGARQRLPFYASVSGGTPPYRYWWSCDFDPLRPAFFPHGEGSTVNGVNCTYPRPGTYTVEVRVADATGTRALCGSCAPVVDVACCTPIPVVTSATNTPTNTPTRTPTVTPTWTAGGPTATPTNTPTVTPTNPPNSITVNSGGIASISGQPRIYNGQYVIQKTDFGFLWLNTGTGSLGPLTAGYVGVEAKCGVGQPAPLTNIYVLGDCNGITSVTSSGAFVQAQQYSGQCGAATTGCGGSSTSGVGLFDFNLGSFTYIGRGSSELPNSAQTTDLIGRTWRVVPNSLTSFTWVTP